MMFGRMGTLAGLFDMRRFLEKNSLNGNQTQTLFPKTPFLNDPLFTSKTTLARILQKKHTTLAKILQ